MGLNKRLIDQVGGGGTSEPNSPLDIAIWTGDGTNPRTISTTNNPDVVILRRRNQLSQFYWYREDENGVIQRLSSSSTSPEGAPGDTVLSLNDGGFTLDDSDFSNNSYNFVGWAFQAGGGYVTNTNGSITSQVSANVGGGFSIVKYTGTGSNTNFGHGLSSAPELTIIKNLDDGTRDWIVHPSSQGSDKYLILNGTNAINTSSIRIQSVNSTVVNIGTNTEVNANGQDFICYNFHSVDGYQKVGSYTGDGTTSNSITTGFEPRFLMIKVTSGADNWVIFDNARDTSNPRNTNLKPNSTAAETDEAGSQVNFTSTGFTCVGSGAGLGQVNSNGSTYIYLAIA